MTKQVAKMKPEAFESPREVLDRARDHVRDLESRIKSFFDRQPYARVVQFDPDTGQDVHKVRITAKIPGSAAAVAKDALANLRDALDHAVYASSVSLRPGTTPRNTAFPFARDAKGVHDKLNGVLTDIPPNIRSLLEAFLPHETGNKLLWGLNATRNIKTHRVLVPLAVASLGNSLTNMTASIVGGGQFGYSRWDATKNEVEYLRVGRGSTLQYDLQMSFDVLFGDVEVLGGQAAIATLNAIASEVEGIVRAIEAETIRFLSLP